MYKSLWAAILVFGVQHSLSAFPTLDPNNKIFWGKSRIGTRCRLVVSNYEITPDFSSHCNFFNDQLIDKIIRDQFKDLFDSEGGSSTVGPANPAAIMCVRVGGKNISMESEAGALSFCQVGEAFIGNWTLFDAFHAKYFNDENIEQSAAVSAYLSKSESEKILGTIAESPSIEQATSLCMQLGGYVITPLPTKKSLLLACRFSDNSIIELMTLFRGPKAKGNKVLTFMID